MMFGWIPLIGPIVDGIVSIFSKWQDTSLGKYKVDGSVDIETIKASTAIVEATKDDIGIRIMRDALLIFPVAQSCLVGWDTIVALHWPQLMFHVAPYPPSLAYLPFAAATFLLGNIAVNAWRRK